MKVLIVEDEPDVVELLSTYVRDRWPEADVTEAGDGRRGLMALEEVRPDLILLDIGLPDIEGWQVLSRIRETSNVPVVVVTGLDRATDLARFLQGGADAYVTKPFTQRSLVESIERAMGGPVKPSTQ